MFRKIMFKSERKVLNGKMTNFFIFEHMNKFFDKRS